MDERLIESLAAAVRAAPDDLPLRLHLAGLLVEADRGAEAVEHVATALAKDPTSAQARELMARAMGTAPGEAAPAAAPAAPPADSPDDAPPAKPSTFDWHAAESDLGETVGPMFVDGSTEDPGPSAYDVEPARVRLADVGGLTEVKKRLEASFLAPLRNPELRALYGKSLRGGLLLYGPPGCGKTFLAKAVAGELGASFLHVSLADVLDMYIGQSERNVKELFEVARTSAPCVLFLDELDAIGGKRSAQPQLRSADDGQPAAHRARRRRVGQRGRLRARRDQPPVGRRPRAAPARAGSTARCSCCRRTARRARRSCAPTCATGPSSASTPDASPRRPRASAAPTSPTCASRPPRTR